MLAPAAPESRLLYNYPSVPDMQKGPSQEVLDKLGYFLNKFRANRV